MASKSLTPILQHTLRKSIRFQPSIGIHSGKRTALRISPAPVNSGIHFLTPNGDSIPACFDHVHDTQLCTELKSSSVSVNGVHTVEHLCAALFASGIHNATVSIRPCDQGAHAGLEVPIMDGSALEFGRKFVASNVRCVQSAKLPVIRILRKVKVESSGSIAIAKPFSDDSYKYPRTKFSALVNFGGALDAGRERRVSWVMKHESPNFSQWLGTIGNARTFALVSQVEMMRQVGKARGGSLDNCVVFPEDGGSVPLNHEGLRHHDEWARHKLLDCIGDCSLLGNKGVLHGELQFSLPGHKINNQLLRAIFENHSNYSIVQ